MSVEWQNEVMQKGRLKYVGEKSKIGWVNSLEGKWIGTYKGIGYESLR